MTNFEKLLLVAVKYYQKSFTGTCVLKNVDVANLLLEESFIAPNISLKSDGRHTKADVVQAKINKALVEDTEKIICQKIINKE